MNPPLRCPACGSNQLVKIRSTTNLAEPLPYVWLRCEECGDVWSVPREAWEDQDRSKIQ